MNAKVFAFHLVALSLQLVSTGAVVRVKRDETWKITTILDPPYTNKTVDNPTKNEDFDGYIPDLLKKIGSTLNLSYTITVVADGKYGAKEGNTWSGMIGEIISNKADVAAAAITVSDARKEVVSFTEPWTKIKSVIVIKKPKDGSESKIKTAQDLVAQKDIKYVVVKDGTTYHLIQNATDPHYITEIKGKMNDYVSTSKEGIQRVQQDPEGKLAFVTESATGDFWAKRKPCDLAVLEINLPQKEYAFAIAKNSPIKAKLDSAITTLKNNGEFDRITKNWWKDECSGGVYLHLNAVLVLLGIVLFFLSSN